MLAIVRERHVLERHSPFDRADPDLGLLVTPAAVWVTSYDDDAIVRIDPISGRMLTTIRVPGRGPTGVAEADGALWVANSRNGSVSRIDPVSNQVTATISMTCRSQCLGGAVPLALAAVANQIWIRNEGDGTVARIDTRTNMVVGTIDVDTFYGRDGQDAIGVTPSAIWLSGISLQRIDPSTGRVVRVGLLDCSPGLRGDLARGGCRRSPPRLPSSPARA